MLLLMCWIDAIDGTIQSELNFGSEYTSPGSSDSGDGLGDSSQEEVISPRDKMQLPGLYLGVVRAHPR